MQKKTFMRFFYLLAAIVLSAAGLTLLLVPNLLLETLHPTLHLSASEQVLSRQAGAGLLLAGLLNLLACRPGAPSTSLHALVLGYLVVFVACHGALLSLWWLWLAVALYALPLIPLPRSLPALGGNPDELRGQIKWFNARKGFGFIVTEDDREIFVHFRALRNGGRQSLRPGTRVRFQVRETERGDQADPVYIEE